ncbi:SH3 domain-binding protein 5-like [Frankliniella fusca]|uniref:SH3 domain-binding protein 5-like n=1 Tax=Frankliniella fusca TaxID=407009 RepID=A0AAE1HVT5_9NEOP|nr:SH3 domain-binding protein 5-like [Frankliniella fusca]
MSSKSSTEESICDNDSECSEEGVDPRVQVELEKLNSATNEINRLEVDLDDARCKFRQLLCDTTLQVDALGKKLGSCVERARPYYDARMKAKEALLETQKAAVQFERANSAHTAAKEMVFLAEEGLKTEGRTFDHAWQEMLNHATMRVNETEMERTTTEAEHRKTSQIYQDAERKVQQLQKDLKRSIAKSRPYFELKSQYNHQMEEQKQRVKKLESQVSQAKASYAEALRNLEQISDEIHKIRNHEMFGGFTDPLGVRGLGVGAESPIQSKNIRASGKTNQAPKRKKPVKQPIASSKGSKDSWLDSDSGDEYLTIPSKLGPAASPVLPQRNKESNDMSQFMGLSGLSGDHETRMQAVAKLEEEVLKDAKTMRLPAERRPSLATSTPSCNSTPKKTPKNPFLPLTNPFQPQNNQSNFLNGGSDSDFNQTWTAINLGESSSDNSPSPAKMSPSGKEQSNASIDIPYRPLLDQQTDEKSAGCQIITPLTDEKASCDDWLRKISDNGAPDGGEEVWTEVSLNDDPETPTTSSLFKKVSFFNTNFSCGRPRNSSTDEDRQSSVELNTPPQSARGSVSLQGTPLKQRMKIDTGLVNWISRSSAAGDEQIMTSMPRRPPIGSRRQSLDTLLWNPTSERMKDILNQGIMMLNISSLTERRSSEPRTEKPSNLPGGTLSPMTGMDQSTLTTRPLKKIPSPLEKSLTYLNAEDDSASDTDSLHSMDMLTDDQISSLMHEPNLREVCQDVLGTPISEVLPGYPATKA